MMCLRYSVNYGRNGVVIAHLIEICGKSMSTLIKNKALFYWHNLHISSHDSSHHNDSKAFPLYNFSQKCNYIINWILVLFLIITIIHIISCSIKIINTNRKILVKIAMIKLLLFVRVKSRIWRYVINNKFLFFILFNNKKVQNFPLWYKRFQDIGGSYQTTPLEGW
jgi:hypothetical protein